MRLFWLPFLIVSATAAAAQDPPPAAPDDAKVSEAIRKGAEWLKLQEGKLGDPTVRTSTRELVLLTLAHAGVSERDAFFAREFKTMLPEEPRFTYRTALRAMLLEEIQRVKYQHLIYHCGEFLVANQASNGQWSYGKSVNLSKIEPVRMVATKARRKPGSLRFFRRTVGPRIKPAVVRRIELKKKGSVGGGGGDNSNSQYAALGLRACHDAGIIIPKETINLAIAWWRKSQQAKAQAGKPVPVASGSRIVGTPRGWDYKNGEKPYGSMSVGAVGALAIFIHMSGKDWKRDQDLADGAAWVASKFTVTSNPIRGGGHHYYYLYGLERAGVLYETPKFGTHDWYAEGAQYLIKSQRPDGSWSNLTNTCFAVLFLKRATRPLVATGEGK